MIGEQQILPLLSETRSCSLMHSLPDIVDIKPANMEELTEVITAAECHPHQCNVFVYSSSKGTIRLCDMRAAALCDRHSKCKSLSCITDVSFLDSLPYWLLWMFSKPKQWGFSPLVLVFEEPEDPSSRSFFSEIISSISDVKFSHSGRYMMTRDYLSVKVWDLNMENRPVETYQVRHRTPDAMFIHKSLKMYNAMQDNNDNFHVYTQFNWKKYMYGWTMSSLSEKPYVQVQWLLPQLASWIKVYQFRTRVLQIKCPEMSIRASFAAPRWPAPAAGSQPSLAASSLFTSALLTFSTSPIFLETGVMWHHS